MSLVASLPHLILEVNGENLPEESLSRLGEVRVHQRLSMPTQCELKFLYPTENFSEDNFLFEIGTRLNLVIQEPPNQLFSGQVTAVKYLYDPVHGYELRIRAYDQLHQLRKRQPVRTHVQLTLSELVQELVQDLGLTVQSTESGPLWPRLIQYNQSDFDLILEVAERCGLYITLQGSVLYIMSLQGFEEEVIPLVYGENLFEAEVEVNGDSTYRKVTTTGWDPWKIVVHEGNASESKIGRQVEAQATPDSLGSPGHCFLMNEVFQDDLQAESRAQTELDRHAANEVRLWGVAEGNVKLRPGARIEVHGISADLEGQYVVASINHTIDASKGYVSEISTNPPTRPTTQPSAMISVGSVTSVDDPESLGRIQVALPAFGDMESDWLEMVSPVAGPEKGFVTFPEIDDKVLVLFADNDATQGVVIGCLFGMNGLPKEVQQGSPKECYSFLTPGKQHIRLDDSQQRLRLEDANGSFIELSPEQLLVHANTHLTIEAPGQPIVIRGNTIDFEQA